jgi:hypothetical protein
MSARRNGIQVFVHADEAKAIPSVNRVKIRWVDAAGTIGDNLLISDADGNKVWESVAQTANCVDEGVLDLKGPVNLVLTTIDAGTLYIYEM